MAEEHGLMFVGEDAASLSRVAINERLKANLKAFWEGSGKDFALWWVSLPPSGQLATLKDVVPDLRADAPTEPLEKRSSTDLLVPELRGAEQAERPQHPREVRPRGARRVHRPPGGAPLLANQVAQRPGVQICGAAGGAPL